MFVWQWHDMIDMSVSLSHTWYTHVYHLCVTMIHSCLSCLCDNDTLMSIMSSSYITIHLECNAIHLECNTLMCVIFVSSLCDNDIIHSCLSCIMWVYHMTHHAIHLECHVSYHTLMSIIFVWQSYTHVYHVCVTTIHSCLSCHAQYTSSVTCHIIHPHDTLNCQHKLHSLLAHQCNVLDGASESTARQSRDTLHSTIH